MIYNEPCTMFRRLQNFSHCDYTATKVVIVHSLFSKREVMMYRKLLAMLVISVLCISFATAAPLGNRQEKFMQLHVKEPVRGGKRLDIMFDQLDL